MREFRGFRLQALRVRSFRLQAEIQCGPNFRLQPEATLFPAEAGSYNRCFVVLKFEVWS
jgi:hypothetical protein